MKSCNKQCRIHKTRIGFRCLYMISWGLTIVEFLAVFAMLFWPAVLRWCGSIPNPMGQLSGNLPDNWFNGLKDVSMTVGLTGVLFAWLLQIIGDQTCGIQMDELFSFEFPGYTWQMFLFIQATIVCIFTCSCKGPGRLLAPIAFSNMLCGIVNMWLMCMAFLFSTSKRRDIAFCRLKDKLSKNWNMDDLSLWARELNTCVARGEKEHIQTFFDLLRAKAEDLFKPEESVLCAEFCGEVMEQIWNATGADHWSRYLTYLLKPPYNVEPPYFLLGTYLLQTARLREREMVGDRYFAVIACLSKGTRDRQTVPGTLLALYLAFYTIHESYSVDQHPDEVFEALGKIKWDKKLDVYQNEVDSFRKCVLRWVLESYGIVCTGDYQAFVCKQEKNEDLRRTYDQYMNLFPWEYCGQ